MSESWWQVLSVFIGNAALIAWFRAESRADWRHMDAQVNSIREEIKDFHGRLERQDAEFKGRLAQQDAEFKSFIMYGRLPKEKS